jgi:UDP-N-acetylmuramoyl-tripeptide--D-alanyl-D-alanine ligase
MTKRSLQEAAAAMAGRVIAGDGASSWQGAALDSRRAGGGALFFAVPGANTDGHRFVRAAFEAGAAAAVVHRDDVDAPAGSALIRVEDTTAALHALTRAVRREVPGHLVGITGSAGKTTTKELLAAMLARRFRVAKSPGNLNNLFGFPLALLGIPDDSEWMVAEMGMSTPGELAGVSRLARPDAVLLTNVGPAHLENFPSIRAIADAKAGILAGLAEGGLVIANADDPEVAAAIERHRPEGPTLWYSITEAPAQSAETADRLLRQLAGSTRPRVRAHGIVPRGAGQVGYRFQVDFEDEGGQVVGQSIELPIHGRYNVSNCLAAAAAAWALGIAPEQLAAAVLDAAVPDGRGAVFSLGGGSATHGTAEDGADGAVVVDDSYNSNPPALRLALESAAALAKVRGARRHWAVLGDMLELGPQAPAFHRQCGGRAAELGFAPIASVGTLAGELLAGAREAGADPASCHAFESAAEAAPWAAATLAAGDLVLVKGSRGVGLEAVVAALRAVAVEERSGAVARGGEA